MLLEQRRREGKRRGECNVGLTPLMLPVVVIEAADTAYLQIIASKDARQSEIVASLAPTIPACNKFVLSEGRSEILHNEVKGSEHKNSLASPTIDMST